MINATISQLKNQLSKYLRHVKDGEVVVVFDRDVPVAEIKPRSKGLGQADDRLKMMEASGLIRRGDPKKIKKLVFPKQKGDSGVVAALLDEREGGR